jgi:hypothetical protein
MGGNSRVYQSCTLACISFQSYNKIISMILLITDFRLIILFILFLLIILLLFLQVPSSILDIVPTFFLRISRRFMSPTGDESSLFSFPTFFLQYSMNKQGCLSGFMRFFLTSYESEPPMNSSRTNAFILLLIIITK